jgi:nucleoside-diphosphate-sugar epimerase
MSERILVTGSCGQLGTELVAELRARFGMENVLATDLAAPKNPDFPAGPFENLNVLDRHSLDELISRFQPTQIYHLAAILSAAAEKNPTLAWDVNIAGYMHVLDAARDSKGLIKKVYAPSSIAVFGPNTPRWETPQHTITDPTTVYGITKLVDERLADYYFRNYGLDVRSIRYPGLISYKTPPGGGTTDYAVDIFYKVVLEKSFTSFLKPDSALPMMYMPDAIRATLELMDAPSDKIKIRSSYNLGAITFTPAELAEEIRRQFGDFELQYAPDFRQAIADSWPASIDDSAARSDWGWKPEFGLSEMVKDMLFHIAAKLKPVS